MNRSSSTDTRARPLQTNNPIDFLIVGGGLAGLACALALRRVGHHVLVLEKGERWSITACGDHGIRLPPNLTKIFFHWGLRDALKEKALVSHTILFAGYESAECFGQQVWDPDLLAETQGVFMVMTHAELYDVICDAAVKAGARVRFGAEVAAVDVDLRQVVLSSGETLSGDVIVGADGEHGRARRVVTEQQGTPSGLVMYDTVIPRKYLPEHPFSMNDEQHGVYVAFGDSRAALAYPIHRIKEYAFQFYGYDDEPQGRYGDAPTVVLKDIAPTIIPRVHSVTSVRIPVRDHTDLEDWVHDSGHFVLIGEAAHPFPPGTIQATAMAVEDGAVLAKLFSHLSSERQIDPFLYAFQELRQPRVSAVRTSERGHASFLAMPACDASRARDAGMRALGARGANVLEGGDGETSGLWDEIRTVFGYDCEDAADDWWVQWGLLRERARAQDGDAGVRAALIGASPWGMQQQQFVVDQA